MVKKFFTLLIVFLFSACSLENMNMPNSEIPEDEHIAVCGKKDNQEQTYPTLKDLKADGATFLHYDPCYN